MEKRGHPLNLAPQASGHCLGLELEVPRLPVFGTGQKDSLVVIISVHFVTLELDPGVQAKLLLVIGGVC